MRFCGIIRSARWLVEQVSGINPFATELMAALIAWMLFVRVDDLVKDGAISAVTRLRRATAPPPLAVYDP
jgi:hypothetical protein